MTGSSDFSQVATTSVLQTTATVSGLTNGQSYDFEVVAENGVGSSSPSVAISSKPFAVVPAAPVTVVSVAAGYGAPYIPGVGPVASSSVSSTVPIVASSAMTSTAPQAVSTSTPSTPSLLAELNALEAQLAALEAQASGSSGSGYAFTRNLQFGTTGKDVQALQEYLIAQNEGPAARALKAHGTTDYFGTLTKVALIEFQKVVGIRPASGYFGPTTRNWIEAH